ncbi:Hsp20/alpha crystallin family protein [Candidatus Manganitrophus noduliformans]|uniref:Hsp20/alpha crystallin family protein n=1 Tax=Candidatus Manganitrophus noduliformans TaxID=2606439 RepID=A0A7X6I9B8_9BACT|nr:Hsp20/alpha crystallin family protein [Candidatus Manganitrophus noduliformans]NKE69308.1 Hsp20/alpha crystallin family protein [Candidatus Manganitrophus noduliformans]
MAIVKWEPLKDFVTFQDRMNQFLSDTLNNYETENGRLVQDWVPAVDVYEDAEAIQLKAELPGMEMREIEVKIENNALEIRGEKKIEQTEKKENYHRIERVFGRFSRSFRLPNTVAQDKIKAKYDRGVLTITLPKREETKPRSITVQVE